MHWTIRRGATVSAVLLTALGAGWSEAADSPFALRSPDGRTTVEVGVTRLDGGPAGVAYRIVRDGREVIARSRLGFELAGAPPLGDLALTESRRFTQDVVWRPVYGERSKVRNQFNELTLELRETAAPQRRLHWTFRAYDAGVAWCATFPKDGGWDEVHIAREKTEFRFPADHPAWATYHAQGKYERVPLSRVKRGCERPLTIQAADDLYVAVAEARLVDYARMKLAPLAGHPHALVSDLSGPVTVTPPLRTPWRVVMIAPSPGRLLESNDLILNLNDPCALADPSWIRPGKVIREVTLTTTGGRACVDFAARRGLQFVEFDAGWYGHEYEEESDATTVTVDPKRSKGPLDLPAVISYARERDIGVILYVNRRALERQLDEILPLFERWGVAGVKYGFVNVGSQPWTTWLHEAVRKAAAHHLMVDVHDEYRPTGYSRTYPNLMTQEGIAGDETSPRNALTLTILFTRMLAGAADNTFCYYNERVERNASHAYQLAKVVCLYSPWQFLYWYDRPPGSPGHTGGAGGGKGRIGEEPELEFFAAVPTVWDDTRVLRGQIGEYAVLARRRGEAWFIGVMNSGQPREWDVPLDFITPGRTYEARVYSDDPSVPTRTHVRIDRWRVDAKTVFHSRVTAQGGQALWLRPTAEAAKLPAYPGPTGAPPADGSRPATGGPRRPL